MKITLVYLPHEADHVIWCQIEVKDDQMIENVLSNFYAIGLALYEYDGIGTGGRVTGKYLSEGPLEDGKWYMIFSKNSKRTETTIKKHKKK